MTSHVNLLVSQCFYRLRRIKNCCRALPRDAVKTLVNSFVTSRVDSCNCLLASTPALTTNKLQRVLNAAAKVIYDGRKFDHVRCCYVTSYIGLKYQNSITYKLCLLTYKAFHGLAPQYLADLCQPLSQIALRRSRRSSTAGHLLVPRTCTKFGQKGFSVAGPRACNSLLPLVRQADGLSTFKRLLKQHLFNVSYMI